MFWQSYGFGNGSDTTSAGVCGHYWECSRNHSKYRNQSKYFRGKGGYHDWQAHWRVLSAKYPMMNREVKLALVALMLFEAFRRYWEACVELPRALKRPA